MTSCVSLWDREILGIRERRAEEQNTKDCFFKIKCIRACREEDMGEWSVTQERLGGMSTYIVLQVCLCI